jgi:molecular chaperone GrpE (heat shock protein)
MRKHHLCLIIVISLALLSWEAIPSSQSQLFDLKKSRQELEIMKGILRTTLDFAAKEFRSPDSDTTKNKVFLNFGGLSNITAFYLYGQGAVFTIPTSSLHRSLNANLKAVKLSLAGLDKQLQDQNWILESQLEGRIQEEMERAQEEMERAQEEMERAQEEAEHGRYEALLGDVMGGVVGGVPGGVASALAPGAPAPPQAPPVPAVPPVPAAPPVTPRIHPGPAQTKVSPERREALRKRLAEAQEKVKKRQEQLELSQTKFREQLAEVKVYLIEALANHGDSLSVVKPNEYVNLILTDDGGEPFFPGFGERRDGREVISVQKSAITDYKAGRLSLDALKQKVLDYSN